MLLLSGDVHINPGPVLYPCRICDKSVRNNQKGLLCDLCGLWCHIKCANVSGKEYDHYCELAEFDWLCPLCLFDQLPNTEIINDDDDDDDFSASADMSFSPDLPSPMDIIGSPVDGVRIVHHNVRGLLSKFSEVSQWLFEAHNSPIILCCSETWITVNDLVPNVTGFDTFCSPVLSRPDKPKSVLPGSCIFVSTLLQPECPPICDVIERSCSVINISSCFVTCKYHRVAVLSVYRSPSTCCSSAITELRSVLLQLSTSAKYIMMAGDFNVDLLSTNNSVTLDYVNLLADFNLSQHIIKPSRVCNHSATLIDHIIGSSSLQVSGVGQAIGLSDHNVQLTDFNIPILKRAPRAMMVRSFNRCDWEGLKDVLDSVP